MYKAMHMIISYVLTINHVHDKKLCRLKGRKTATANVAPYSFPTMM